MLRLFVKTYFVPGTVYCSRFILSCSPSFFFLLVLYGVFQLSFFVQYSTFFFSFFFLFSDFFSTFFLLVPSTRPKADAHRRQRSRYRRKYHGRSKEKGTIISFIFRFFRFFARTCICICRVPGVVSVPFVFSSVSFVRHNDNKKGYAHRRRGSLYCL